MESSNGSIRTRPASISARMSLSERSTSRGYARRAERPPSDGPARLLTDLSVLLQSHRNDAPKPRTARTADKPSGTEALGLLHRERSGAEHVPIGTTDDGALHQVQESLPQEPRRATAHLTTNATLRDERDGPPGGTPVPPGPSSTSPPYAPTPAARSPVPPLKRT